MDTSAQENFAVYKDRRDELVAKAEGDYVLIAKQAVVDTFKTEDDAMREGYRRFGTGPFLVHKISKHEPDVVFASNFIVP